MILSPLCKQVAVETNRRDAEPPTAKAFVSERCVGVARQIKRHYNVDTVCVMILYHSSSELRAYLCMCSSILLEDMPEASFQAACALWAEVFAKDGRTAETVAMERKLPGDVAEMWHLVWTDQGHRRYVLELILYPRFFFNSLFHGIQPTPLLEHFVTLSSPHFF